MAITTETIHATQGDEALLKVLATELQALLPIEAQQDRAEFHRILASLPRGLRAMASTHEFFVSMDKEDLARHFSNQTDERDLNETLNGLHELELAEIAGLFEQAKNIMEPHMEALRTRPMSPELLEKWLEEIGAQDQIDPMNDILWDLGAECGPLGLHQYWIAYARKYPERCTAA